MIFISYYFLHTNQKSDEINQIRSLEINIPHNFPVNKNEKKAIKEISKHFEEKTESEERFFDNNFWKISLKLDETHIFSELSP